MQDIGTQFHIRCEADQVGRYCFLPGDPGRCQSIAAHFDEIAESVNNAIKTPLAVTECK